MSENRIIINSATSARSIARFFNELGDNQRVTRPYHLPRPYGNRYDEPLYGRPDLRVEWGHSHAFGARP